MQRKHYNFLLTSRTTGVLTAYWPISPTGNMDTRVVYRISSNNFKSNVLSSSPKYITPGFLPFFRIQLMAARRFATPRGIAGLPRYMSGMGLAMWVYGIPGRILCIRRMYGRSVLYQFMWTGVIRRTHNSTTPQSYNVLQVTLTESIQ